MPSSDALQGHRKRLREKFIKSGLAVFNDYEIIELLLSLGTPRKDCKQQAKEAIKRFKTLRGVLEAPPQELQQIDGIGAHSAFGIKLVQEVAREFLKEKIIDKPIYKSAQEIFDYLYHSMRDLKEEVLKAIYLNSRNEIIDTADLFEGSLESIPIRPREIVEGAITHGAVAIIFVHNHPSGDPAPSKSDKQFTRDLAFVGQIIQIKVLDHIIIGGNSYFSFADEELIKKYELDFLNFKIRGVSDSRVNYPKGFIIGLLIPAVMGIATGIMALSDIG